MTVPHKPGFHEDDATLSPHGETLHPDAVANDQTIAPPPDDTANPNDVTLAPPPASTRRSVPHAALTLPQPPLPRTPARPIAETLEVGQPPPAAPPLPADPNDATLDPQDPQAQAYQQAVAKGSPPGVSTSASFGDYQLIEPIAKGGMGIVYKARQRKLNRVVAIKMILAGQFADRTDVDRFYAEAEAAAALTHPNIVAIHEIGEVSGQHFFSMDYIEGQSLAGMVRDSTFTAPQAAEYVKTIAATMQFAHDRGIVHRDLKPSNVLVDKQLRPLITDFGLAKQVSNQSQLTMSGAIVGTPSYMPPEQAAGEGDRVGPRSDIYSMGAILYELLTGRPPFRAASPFETVRQVIENDPLSPRLVNPSVPKDLETICLKCLQKDPAKRYDTSQALADELQRFLVGEPIHARPVGRIERFWKVCKRYPYTSGAIAIAVLFLVFAAGAASTAYVMTSRALAKSEESLREAIGAVNDYLTLVSENTLLKEPGMQPLRKGLLELALAYYQRFLDQRGNDPLVQDELGTAYYRIGMITTELETTEKAIPYYEQAYELQRRLLAQSPDSAARLEAFSNTLVALGTAKVKRKLYDEARQHYGEAIATRERLAETDTDNSEYQRMLANTHMNMGVAEYSARALKAAKEAFLSAQSIRQVAIAKNAKNFKLRRDLGKGYYNIANLDYDNRQLPSAEENFDKARGVFQSLVDEDPDNPENETLLVQSLRLLADIQSESQPDKARKTYAVALDRLGKLAYQNPYVREYQHDRARVFMNLGFLESNQQQRIAALDAFRQARETLAPLAERFPNVPLIQRDLAATLRATGLEYQASGEIPSAKSSLLASRGILASLVVKYPSEREFTEQLEDTNAALAELDAPQQGPAP